jgi:hypothetical protein
MAGDLNALLLILGCVLAMSSIIVARRPDAKAVIDKLVAFQALIGIVLVVLGVIHFIQVLPTLTDIFKVNLLRAAVVLAVIGASVLLGVLFGAPQIAKLMPDLKAEQKAMELAKKIAPYQVLLGLAGLVSALVYFLYRFKIITYSA